MFAVDLHIAHKHASAHDAIGVRPTFEVVPALLVEDEVSGFTGLNLHIELPVGGAITVIFGPDLVPVVTDILPFDPFTGFDGDDLRIEFARLGLDRLDDILGIALIDRIIACEWSEASSNGSRRTGGGSQERPSFHGVTYGLLIFNFVHFREEDCHHNGIEISTYKETLPGGFDMETRTDPITPVSPADVTITDEFWRHRIDTNATETIWYVYERLEEDGRVENFRQAAAGNEEYEREGRPSCDADLHKWLEGACRVLVDHEDPELRETVDEVVDLIASVQRDDGYVDTYFELAEPGERWTNLGMMHELYVAGHLFEAAIAHHELTDNTKLLDVARRFADHISETFGEEEEKIHSPPGHPEIEIALVRLARATGEERFRELAQYFVDARGTTDRFEWELENPEKTAGGDSGSVFERLYADDDGEYDGRYAQDHKPLREQRTIEGHAVKATYLFTGATALLEDIDDPDLLEAMLAIWDNMRTKRMYVTGGIGSASYNEGFTEDYDLPNEDAYSETCGAISNVLWNDRLFRITGDHRHQDIIERALYNALLSGVSLDGKQFFYRNPLAATDHERSEWFERCPCCPTNVVRFLPRVPEYIYSTTDDELFVNLYIASDTAVELAETDVDITLESELPWEDGVSVTVDPEEATSFSVNVRIPDWATSPTVRVNGAAVEGVPSEGIMSIDRTWQSEDRIEIDFGLEAEQLVAHPAVRNNAGRTALRRGPLVYCLEEPDAVENLDRVELTGTPTTSDSIAELQSEKTLVADASITSTDGWSDTLYRLADDQTNRSDEVTAIPYYAWNHRGTCEMQVWVRSTN